MSTKPLAGVKVVDFSMAASGPACTKLLAEWGADVVKIEIFGGEMMRFRPFELHEWANMNKREIVCNVKSDEGRELVYKLCKESDFFITNYRTKALKKLKLDYESVSAQNPGIVYGSVTGYGDHGPEAETPGYDVTAFWARTGLMYELIEKGSSPLVSPLGIGDYALATAFTGPLMAAYVEKLRTGKGEHVSASLYSFGLYVNQWYVMRPQADPSFQYPVSRKNVKEPMSNCFRTKDDHWFQMTVFDFDRYFPILMEIAGRTDVLGQPGYSSFADITENHNAVTEILDAGFAQYDFADLAKIFAEKNIAYAKINLPGDVLDDEQAWANHYLYTHEFRDGYKMIMPSSPFKFGVNEAPDHEWAPRVGATVGGILFTAGIAATSFVGQDHPELLYVTYGGVAGAGVGFGYAAALNCIQKWFPNNRGLAVGLAVASFGISTAVFAPLVNVLLELPQFGERAVPLTFRTLAFLFGGIVLLAGQFLKNPEADFQQKRTAAAAGGNRRQYTFGEAIRCPEFWIICTCLFFSMGSYLMLNPIIKTLGISREMSAMEINLTISATGISSAISRLGSPILSDKIGKRKAMMVLLFINMVSVLTLTFAGGLVYAAAVQLAVIAYGGPAGICATMVMDSFGTRYSGTIHGVSTIFFGLSSFAFPKLSTILYGCTGSYATAFVVGAVACIPSLLAVSQYDRLHEKRVLADAER